MDQTDEGDLPAGDFAAWLTEVQGAIRGEHPAEVPCGDCTACCTSSQFVHIEPDETDAVAHIPAELLFPAPRLPRGHLLMGYDERGHCPMLVAGACSIYQHRPRTCRTYDCRVFPAAGLNVGDDKPTIGLRARRWRFSFPSDADVARQREVTAAGAFLAEHGEQLGAAGPPTTTQLAVAAVELHGMFGGGAVPEPSDVAVELRRRQRRGPAAKPRA